jgi:hypothetical protein
MPTTVGTNGARFAVSRSMRHRTTALAITAALTACALSPGARGDATTPPAAPKPVAAPVLTTIERTMCLGTCPAYSITVRADGSVEFDGKQYVEVKGRAVAQLSKAELGAMRKLFANAKYFDLADSAGCYESTDAPYATTSFHDGKRLRTLRHYYGCHSPPEAKILTDLEARFDEIVGSERWIGRGETAGAKR